MPSRINITTARRILREQTGMSHEWVNNELSQLRTIKDGARHKFLMRDIQNIIDRENAPVANILSKRNIASIQRV